MLDRPASVLELYEGHPERWTQGINARDVNGHSVTYPCNPTAVSWCLLGAIGFVSQATTNSHAMTEKVRAIIGSVYVTQFNDDPKRTFEEVLDVVRRAGI